MKIIENNGYGFNFIKLFSKENIKKFTESPQEQNKLIHYQTILQNYTQKSLPKELKLSEENLNFSDSFIKFFHINSNNKIVGEKYGLYLPNISRIITDGITNEQITPERANILLSRRLGSILRHTVLTLSNYEDIHFYTDSKLIFNFINFYSTEYKFENFKSYEILN